MSTWQNQAMNVWQHNPVAQFIDWVLRGIGQVMLQNSPITGLIFLIGIFVGSYVSGLYALLGTIVATLTALALGVSRGQLKDGLYGFNGTLVGIALALFIKEGAITFLYIIIACIFVTIVTTAIQAILAAKRISTLTSPFVLTTWIFLEAAHSFGHLAGPLALSKPAFGSSAAVMSASLGFSGVITAFFNGTAQVMLQQNVWTGVIFLIGILVNSRISCLAAAAGSLIGVGTAWVLGAPTSTIQAGLYSYDAVLTSIALGGLLYVLNGTSVFVTIFAAVITVIVHDMFIALLGPTGLPPLTAAFVLNNLALSAGEGCVYATTGSLRRAYKDTRAASKEGESARSARGGSGSCMILESFNVLARKQNYEKKEGDTIYANFSTDAYAS